MKPLPQSISILLSVTCHCKNWAGVLPVCCSLKLNFRERKGPKV